MKPVPLQADATGLQHLSVEKLARTFQVSADNPLDGLQGRVALLNGLGDAVAAKPEWFGKSPARVGHLFDHLSAAGGAIELPQVLRMVLEAFGGIWPGRVSRDGINLGDTWHHRAIVRTDSTHGLVPFHKLSQWLTYSLVEPLLDAGVAVNSIGHLTGLAEYRNGGLFLDLSVIALREPDQASLPQRAESELVVEWRALTVALIDRLAPRVWQRLGLADTPPPLAALLEGGTWNAGRRIAAQRRADGAPPIYVVSDGTVF